MISFLKLALPKFSLIAFFIKKPFALLAIVPASVAVSKVVNYQEVWVIFAWFFAGDLLSGIYGSYCVWRKKPDRKDKWFFGRGEGFNSNAAKKMGVKLAVYLCVPQLLIKLQTTLLIKTFKYETISDAEFELATIAVIFFCLIEGFSIFHENLPKAGFDLWKSIKKMIGFYKEVKSEIKEIKNDDN